jgi:hypothetical protein
MATATAAAIPQPVACISIPLPNLRRNEWFCSDLVGSCAIGFSTPGEKLRSERAALVIEALREKFADKGFDET